MLDCSSWPQKIVLSPLLFLHLLPILPIATCCNYPLYRIQTVWASWLRSSCRAFGPNSFTQRGISGRSSCRAFGPNSLISLTTGSCNIEEKEKKSNFDCHPEYKTQKELRMKAPKIETPQHLLFFTSTMNTQKKKKKPHFLPHYPISKCCTIYCHLPFYYFSNFRLYYIIILIIVIIKCFKSLNNWF